MSSFCTTMHSSHTLVSASWQNPETALPGTSSQWSRSSLLFTGLRTGQGGYTGRVSGPPVGTWSLLSPRNRPRIQSMVRKNWASREVGALGKIWLTGRGGGLHGRFLSLKLLLPVRQRLCGLLALSPVDKMSPVSMFAHVYNMTGLPHAESKVSSGKEFHSYAKGFGWLFPKTGAEGIACTRWGRLSLNIFT